MKKKFFLFLIASVTLLLLTGSSPWEGAAAVAPAGELPEAGFFVATNSFPRNSVVDITNIETGRTVRAIVANTLGNSGSGLLAIISREAAELIGMRSGSISRIRMIQPSDPMAYTRFTESLVSGYPFHDPSVTEENLLEELYRDDTYVPHGQVSPSVTPSILAQTASPSSGNITDMGIERGYVVDEPEWGGSGRLNIVDIPEYQVNPSPQLPERGSSSLVEVPPAVTIEPAVIPEPAAVAEFIPGEPVKESPETSIFENITDFPAENITQPEHVRYVDAFSPAQKETAPNAKAAPVSPVSLVNLFPDTSKGELSDEIIKDVSDRFEEVTSPEIVKVIPEYAAEALPEEIDKETPVFIAEENINDDINKEAANFITELPREEIVKVLPDWSEFIEIAFPKEPVEVVKETPASVAVLTPLVPVESTYRAPEPTIYDIPLSDIIPGITINPYTNVNQPEIPESSFISGITQSSAPSQSAVIPPSLVISAPEKDALHQDAPREVSPAAVIPPSLVISGPASAAAQLPVLPSAIIPREALLEVSDQYTASPPVSTQPSFSIRTISQLDRGQYYVQIAALAADQIESNVKQIDPRYNPVIQRDGSLYRILIGPLNQGESAAVLQRFRSIGFTDAFVRHVN